jgi:virulence factor Mce-like protein
MTLRYAGAFKAGLIFVALTTSVLLVALLINLNFGLPFNLSLWPPGQDYTLNATFKDANGVTRGADVLIAGHPVGQVTGVGVEGNRSIVAMRISQQYAPIHRGSIARIRYSTLLAQKYIELAPIRGAETIPSGGTIPSDETITPVDFDQFLSALDPETRLRLQVVIQQLGAGVDGRQQTINDLLDQLNGLSVESKPPLDTFATHDENLDHIVGNLSISSQRLAQSHENLGQLVTSANDVNGRMADQNTALAGLIHHLANLMTDFNVTLDGNQQNLHDTVVLLDPLIGQLNVAFGTTDGYLAPSLDALKRGFSQLGPEGESAIHQKDANGNYLRQYLVADPACDQINQTYNKQCGNGSPNPEREPSTSSSASSSASGSSSSSNPPSSDPGSSPTPSPSATPTPTPQPTCDPLLQLLGRC